MGTWGLNLYEQESVYKWFTDGGWLQNPIPQEETYLQLFSGKPKDLSTEFWRSSSRKANQVINTWDTFADIFVNLDLLSENKTK